jgi:predicted ATP-dependent protease
MIPRSNLRNLMLKDEVVAAVKVGNFHIWSVETIDQGIEILTGVPAGERGADGSYPEGTINHKVDRRLREILENMKKFSAGNEKDDKK